MDLWRIFNSTPDFAAKQRDENIHKTKANTHNHTNIKSKQEEGRRKNKKNKNKKSDEGDSNNLREHQPSSSSSSKKAFHQSYTCKFFINNQRQRLPNKRVLQLEKYNPHIRIKMGLGPSSPALHGPSPAPDDGPIFNSEEPIEVSSNHKLSTPAAAKPVPDSTKKPDT